MSKILEIDGSMLEGGGQILRISISLSALLGIPVRIVRIRAGRSKPGLAAQHLTGIQLVARMCEADVKGAVIGSTEVEFIPGKILGGDYVADTRTAGSISLLLQVALPCALFANGDVRFVLKGGTNADMAPQIDYMDRVFKSGLNKFGADFNMDILRRGYFPKGGGQACVNVSPVRKLQSIQLTERGNVEGISGTVFVAGSLPMRIGYRMAESAQNELNTERNVQIHTYKETRQMAPDNGHGIILACTLSSGCVLGSDALGKPGIDSAEAGRQAGAKLQAALRKGTCVDQHMQDQLIIYMALAEGTSAVLAGDITLHTKTAIHVAEMIAKVKFNIEPMEDLNLIQCTGIGLVNQDMPTK